MPRIKSRFTISFILPDNPFSITQTAFGDMSCYFEVEPMLDIPIEEALKELPLCNEIKAGYLDNGTI